ncbi:putative ribonuclease H-like domain-containing protein [Tanacetum coccineum]
MSASNQQTLTDSGANDRPPMLEKVNYISWESRLRRFLDNKLEDGEWMWRSIQKGPYVRLMIHDPDDTMQQIIEPLSKMTEINKKQYTANVGEMWERVKRLMYGSEVTNHVRHSRLMDEFDKFAAKEEKSLESVYERLTTLVNIMDRNNVRPISVSTNTKFLDCLQSEWRKYVTMVRHNQTGHTVSYDQLYDFLVKFEPHLMISTIQWMRVKMPRNNVGNRESKVQFEPHVITSKAKKVAKNHDPLALLAHSNASSSQSHANSSYSPQPYYVTHPSSVVDYEDEYQGELHGGSQEDKLTTAMMLLARAITLKFSTPTNNRLRTSSNTRNEAVIQDGNGNDESNQIVQRVPRTDSTLGKENVQCYNCNEKGHYARDCQKSRVCDAKYFREQMLLAMKDEAESNLKDKENDFMLDNSYGYETLEEITVAVIMMARIRPADDNAESEPSYDAKAVSEVNASNKVHEQVNRVKCKTIIHISDDDQLDSNIIFDDLYVENNGGTSEHDSNGHDEYHDI